MFETVSFLLFLSVFNNFKMKKLGQFISKNFFLAVSHFPLWLLYGFSSASYFVLRYILRYRQQVIQTNLRNSFPEKSAAEIKAIHGAFLRHFCDLVFETIKALTISEKEMKKRFLIKNPEVVNQFYDQNRSVILFAAHLGNWEWFISMPYYFQHRPVTLYQKLSSGFMDGMVRYCRERTGILAAESANGYKTIAGFAAQNIPTITLIIGDQSPVRKSSKHWVRFLNQDTAFLVGADRIAKKNNQLVVYPSFSSPRRGYYEVELKLIEADAATSGDSTHIIDLYAQYLEQDIIKNPALWLWSHRRWKLKEAVQKVGQLLFFIQSIFEKLV